MWEYNGKVVDHLADQITALEDNPVLVHKSYSFALQQIWQEMLNEWEAKCGHPNHIKQVNVWGLPDALFKMQPSAYCSKFWWHMELNITSVQNQSFLFKKKMRIG